jgi:foldase protein PrsA
VTRALPRFAAFAVVLAVLSACASSGGSAAATVGDVEISDARLQRDVVAFTFLGTLQGSPCGTPIAGETQESACARLTLTNEIQEEIVKSYAGAHDLRVDEQQVRDAIAQVEQNVGGADTLEAQLADAGLTREELSTLARRLLLFNVVRDAVTAERLDDAALRDLYQQSLPQLTSVDVAHILVPTRAEAEQIATEATPENFARLAKQHSTDTASAQNGGDLGTFSEAQFRQQFDPTFADAALALEAGEISGVVETSFGFHVIRMVSRAVPTFEQSRDQLAAQQGQQVFFDWLAEQYATTDISVNPRFGRLDDTGRVVPIRTTQTSFGPTGATGTTSSGGATGATGSAGSTGPTGVTAT